MKRSILLFVTRISAITIQCIAGVILLGYLIGEPVMYSWPHSAAMAVPTAICLLLVGMSLLALATLCDD